MVDWPLVSSWPMTRHESFFRRSIVPSGSSPPYSSLRTVVPTMHTALPERSSLSVNSRPAATRQFRTRKYSLVTPSTVVDQFWSPYMAVRRVDAVGATAASEGMSLERASASTALNGGAVEDCPGPSRCPGLIRSRLLPRLAIWSVTCTAAPPPMVTMMITAATPMTMPSMVRDDRSTFRRISRMASNRAFHSIRRIPHVDHRPPPAHRRSAPFAGHRPPCPHRG